MKNIFCKTGDELVFLGQEWEIPAREGKVLVLKVEQLSNNQVFFEIVRAENDGKECDLFDVDVQNCLDRFGNNEKFYFATETWNFVWKDMKPLQKNNDDSV